MQGGRDWWHILNAAYQDLGYQTFRINSCVHSRAINTKHTIMNTFNDNIFGVFKMERRATEAKQELEAIYIVKDLGCLSFILEMAIHKDWITHAISLSQKTYLT